MGGTLSCGSSGAIEDVETVVDGINVKQILVQAEKEAKNEMNVFDCVPKDLLIFIVSTYLDEPWWFCNLRLCSKYFREISDKALFLRLSGATFGNGVFSALNDKPRTFMRLNGDNDVIDATFTADGFNLIEGRFILRISCSNGCGR